MGFNFCSHSIVAGQTSRIVNLFLSRQPGLLECAHPFIDKPMVITEPTVASARLLGLGSTIYHDKATSCACSTKILIKSCRVFLEFAKLSKRKKDSAGRVLNIARHYKLGMLYFFPIPTSCTTLTSISLQ